ncbi:MAG: hypothetical protein LBP60_07695 [Spirochaetaceae bacterium]|jgi:hypothetical protein|nr:hypothetical protein [Spirochaetaceae bacterium]
MQKKKNTKSKVVDLLIVILCLAGAAGSGMAFWREYNRTLVKLNEEPVGLIVFKNRTAHRKIEDRVAWDRLKQASPVYNGDTIRTAELSEAIITFQDQVTNITLSENTLIQIFYDSEGVRIDFVAGNLGVVSGDTNVYIANDSFSAELGQNSRAGLQQGSGGFEISVLEGQAVYDGTEINSGQFFSFLSNGTRNTNPALTVTSLGKIGTVFGPSAGDLIPVEFAWNVSNFDGDTRVIVELAQDKNFSRIVRAQTVSGAGPVSLDVKPGVYWWRAYPVRSGSSEPANPMYPSGRIEAAFADPPRVTSPAGGARYTFPGESRIPLSWSAVEGVEAYRIEISSTPDMTAPAVSRRVQGNSVLQTGLEPGRWYWRVIPIYPGQSAGLGTASEINEFSISRGDPVLGTPSLARPAQNGFVGADNSRLVWSYDANAAFWTVEVADNPQMSNPLVTQDSPSNFYSLPPDLQVGKTYYWRVTARGENASAASPLGSFTVGETAYEQRVVFPPDNYFVAADAVPGFRFSYRAGGPYRTYLQISSQSDFSSLELNSPVEASGSYTLPGTAVLSPGTWYWRILSDAPVPRSSSSRRFTVVSTAEAPRISLPALVNSGTSLTVRWNNLNFSQYKVNLYDAANSRRSLMEQTVQANSVTIPDSVLGPGNYIVSVQGFNAESARSAQITGIPARAAFTVPVAASPVEEVFVAATDREMPAGTEDIGEMYVKPALMTALVPEPPEPEPVPEPVALQPLPPPDLQALERLSRVSGEGTIFGPYPANGYILSRGQLTSASSMNFIWNGKAREYRFALYRANGDLVVSQAAVSSPFFTLPNPGQLTEGEYVWQVFEPDGRGLWRELPSMANRFTVTISAPLRQLPTADPGVLYGRP